MSDVMCSSECIGWEDLLSPLSYADVIQISTHCLWEGLIWPKILNFVQLWLV